MVFFYHRIKQLNIFVFNNGTAGGLMPNSVLIKQKMLTHILPLLWLSLNNYNYYFRSLLNPYE